MHARNRFGSAAGLLAALTLSLAGCGSEPAPQGEVPETAPPAADAPAPQDSPPPAPQDSPPPAPRAEALAGSELFVSGQPLPEGFPSDLPVPPDASYVGSFANQGLAARWTSAADAKQLAEQLRASFEASDAWKLENVRENGDESMLLASRGTQGVIAAVSPEPGSGSKVDVFVLDISDLPTE